MSDTKSDKFSTLEVLVLQNSLSACRV